ncbi:MAG: hypothetical protein QW667_04360 [Candidatus Bathyarchaeia archaeon]
MGLLQNIREVFKMLRYRKPSKIYCPKCGSPKIRLSSSLDYWLTPKKYVCEKCGYVGPLVMELEEGEGTE